MMRQKMLQYYDDKNTFNDYPKQGIMRNQVHQQKIMNDISIKTTGFRA